ncbi:MAG TPA: UvrD-helicase domain-containing protein, partial [Candidatus Avilachnospira avicola]|nr:UvrD-helicase domain-containing protein [Candidatus Avilachnospira avicola]
MMQWTEEQKRVIDERGSNILVSAAAGSGKTAVLCERIIERLCDPEEPVSLDCLLIMTFTRAAAEEMKDRIASALSERIAATEDEALLSHLRKQRLLLRDADISTIDSLCRRLLREYYQDLDIDPGARTAEEGELRVLRADVLSELLEDRYTEGDRAFLDFAESFSSRRNDEKLSEMIEDTYMFIQGDPWPRLFLRRMIKEAEDEMEGKFYGLPWYGYLMERIKRDAMEQKELLSSCIPICEEEGGPGPYTEAVQELSTFFDSILDARDYGELYRLIPGYKPSRLKAVRSKDVDVLKKNAVKQCIDISRERIKSLSSLFMLPPDIMKRAVSGAASYIKELVLLSSDFMDRFDAAKREKNIVDFNDMEHLCLQILYDETEEGMKPSAIADELCMRYDEILVDEYQDSNMVQEALIYALSAERFGRPDVFMVGDVKQSIYRFRLAKPELFMDKYHSYRTGEGSGPEGVRIDLNRNFRSRDQVIGSVNDVFMRIMGRELGGIDYDESAALHKGAEFEGEGQDYVTELEILDISKEENDEAEADRSLDPYAELSADEQEALLIGWKIKEMTGCLGDEKRLLISDRQHGGLRPVSYGDIAILLRAPGKRADTYVDMLSALGIPAYTESSHGYFDAYEVRIMLSFLNIIDDPRQDIDLAAVMRSMIGGFSDEELARIRILFEGRGDQPSGTGLTDLYEALMYCSSLGSEGDISGKCKSFLSLLNELRDLSDMIPVGRLIGRIYART